MGCQNSRQDVYLGITTELYRDIAQCYSVPLRMQRIELRVISARYAKEGLSFLTKTLLRWVKAVDRALANGTRLSIDGFNKPVDSAIPHFMGWLLSRVFDASGTELINPDPIALSHIRQFGHLLSKLEVPYAKKTEESVINAFVATDEQLASFNDGPIPLLVESGSINGDAVATWDDEWICSARDLVTRVISGLDPFDINPSHGPGAVATGEKTLDKCVFKRIYSRLEEVYPFSEWMHFNLSHVSESINSQGFIGVTQVSDATAKVVLVPKDSRGPRLISCEPLEIQWIQQGLKKILQDRIENSRWTTGRVNFTRQDVNRGLAMLGSHGLGWVTLDMKEASDRVHLKLVEKLFEGHPELLRAILACRSTHTKLPNGTVIPLNKFAPMGSALCFPVESLCFWALSVCAIKRERHCTWRQARESVFVYGDDIIVRDQDYATLLNYLPRVGLMFNADKCCTARFFRESCGCDAYAGVDVTPTRLRTVWSRRRNARTLTSYVAFYNAMLGRRYYHTAAYVMSLLDSVYGNQIPFTDLYNVAPNGAYVSQAGAPAYVAEEPKYPLNQRRVRSAFNRPKSGTQVYEVYTWIVLPKKKKTKHDGYRELLRRYSGGYGSHGGNYALPRRNCLKRGWAQV